MFLRLLCGLAVILLTSDSVYSALDDDFELDTSIDYLNIGLSDSYKMSYRGNGNHIESSALDLMPPGIRLRFFGTAKQVLDISASKTLISGQDLCRNARGQEPTYQKTPDGTLWFTNCKVGQQASESDIALFKEKVEALKAKERSKKAEKQKFWKAPPRAPVAPSTMRTGGGRRSPPDQRRRRNPKVQSPRRQRPVDLSMFNSPPSYMYEYPKYTPPSPSAFSSPPRLVKSYTTPEGVQNNFYE